MPPKWRVLALPLPCSRTWPLTLTPFTTLLVLLTICSMPDPAR